MREGGGEPPVGDSTGGEKREREHADERTDAHANGTTGGSARPYRLPLPRLSDLPASLVEQSIWYPYRHIWPDGAKKPKKPPVDARRPGAALARKEAGGVPAAAALAYAREHGLDGIGIRLPTGTWAVDLDHHLDVRTGDPQTALALDVMIDWPSYAELSPGLDGAHMLAEGDLDRTRVDHAQGVEVYAPGQYLTITARRLPGSPADLSPADPAPILRRYLARDLASEPQEPAREPPVGHDTPGTVAAVMARLSRWARDLIEQGIARPEHGEPGIDAYGRDRSRAVYGALRDLIATGASDDLILDILIDPAHGISRAALERRGGGSEGAREWLLPQIGKVRAEMASEMTRDFGDILASNDPAPTTGGSPPPARLVQALITAEGFERALARALRQPWLVDRWLPGGGTLVAMIAAAKSGKSFVALDMACHIAAGLPEWHGYAVTQAPVLYIAAEGQHGLLVRLAAWLRAHDRDPTGGLPGLDIEPLPIRLDDPEQLAELVPVIRRRIDMGARYRLIVIDTLARSMTGDENSTRDMGALIDACGQLQRAGMTVLLIHHLGKDRSAGARGSSALPGAVEMQLDIRSDGLPANPITVTAPLAKDIEPPPPLRLRARVVDVGTGARGEPITSLVLAGAEGEGEELSLDIEERRAILRLIAEFGERGERISPARNSPLRAYKQLADEPGYPGLADGAIQTMVRDLQRSGYLAVETRRNARRQEEEWLVITPAGRVYAETGRADAAAAAGAAAEFEGVEPGLAAAA
ncbi:Regulatory protein RepA [Thiorhodovibrio winogradskyi]|uniref:Regulatory protein RepA n=1 Tax=Thiorhodovibrio winogradskyi TaxID=77007 RepID=A0ABZ0S8L2_9GAMM|nr:AAA family ATPase [Thiorhodovibrio winogradskyi]